MACRRQSNAGGQARPIDQAARKGGIGRHQAHLPGGQGVDPREAKQRDFYRRS